MGDPHVGKCPVCQIVLNEGQGERIFETDNYRFRCLRCGQFECTWNVCVNVLPHLHPSEWQRLSGVLRERFERDGRKAGSLLITDDNLKSLIASAPAAFDIPNNARKLLAAVARRTSSLGAKVQLDNLNDAPLAYAIGRGEFKFLIDYLVELGWLKGFKKTVNGKTDLTVTPRGWEEAQRRPHVASTQGFVAMSFDPAMNDAYFQGIQPAIEDDCGYRCRRIDFKEFNQDIVFELMAEIRESRFVVADLTQQKNGVYFEAGFARGRDIPVIWTCRADDAKNIHFDASHDKQIRWNTPADLRKAIETRIIATIGHGPLKPPTPTI